MFAEVKESLPISGDDYDAQIITQIKAAALDLTTSAEIRLSELRRSVQTKQYGAESSIRTWIRAAITCRHR